MVSQTLGEPVQGVERLVQDVGVDLAVHVKENLTNVEKAIAPDPLESDLREG